MPEASSVVAVSDSAKRRIFDMLDVDGDGVISQSEYLARVDRVASAMGRGAADPVVDAARNAHEVVWQDMDGDHDGRVSFEEYRRWAGHETFDRSCRPALGSLFDIADFDGDGRLDRDEFTRLRVAAGNVGTDADAAFDGLDVDRDGFVDRDAYLAGIRDFVTTGVSAMAAVYGADESALNPRRA
ncbi:EF-hand domain-containing protein [Streptomyces sp. RerS4]|uniref:EF-hand domain-containing protein n=1 Tax=Streptomyces sp. RerS4 TaxID=2942449 RepID=UPI00201BC546|nr:EF-hand domain-containing protein [Streptomyces sp. RerS4]UQW99349.1 EF-hand domain-containing protein [Streptomyces sp. RerS4]